MKIHTNSYARGFLEIISVDAKTGLEVWRSPKMHNLILDAGLALIAQHHAGVTTNALAITSLEIGSGSTAVSGSQTALVTPVLTGVTPTETAPSGASIELEFFIVDGDLTNGTYREVGLRAGATLYTRALFTTPYVKASGRNTIIRYTLSYAAA
ncbi:hypothetical protein [Tsuneonella sp. HG222]